MASNEVHAFQQARDAHAAAMNNPQVSKETRDALKAAADAKKAATPGGRGMD